MFLLNRFLNRLIKHGTFKVVDPRGQVHSFGDGSGPSAAIRLHDTATIRRIGLNPGLAVGEAYMNGRLDLEEGDIYNLLELACVNLGWGHVDLVSRMPAPLRMALKRVQQFNPVGRAKANVAHHYDLSGELYDLFLDADRQYSCAYFLHPDDTLEIAQEQKKRHIAAKLSLAPGQRVLDIGCGWGGLALFLARCADVEVVGCTLSEEQFALASRRAAEAGLGNRVKFVLEDYRKIEGPFDRIVSVGMFEHVGVLHYGEFFRKCATLLKPDGVALLHTIGRSDGPGATNAWIRKYIFPGGYSPAMSEVIPEMERARLYVTDIEILRLHYAETLRHWRLRFMASRDKVKALYDERFCRMWEFYLAACEATFRYGGHSVFQIQFTRHVATLPITRDYMLDWERAHAPANAQQIAAE